MRNPPLPVALASLSHPATGAREIMDDPDCDPETLWRTYSDFRYVNAGVSGLRTTYRQDIRPLLSSTRTRTLLDIGSGGGDVARSLARWAAADGLRLSITAIDPDPRAHAYAMSRPAMPRLTFRSVYSSDLVAEGQRFDIVLSNHILHHLSGHDLGALLADSEHLATVRALHGDIERTRYAYLGFWLVTLPLFPASYIRPDGLTSIRRSFTAAELRAVLPPAWQVVRKQPSRYVLRWDAPRTRDTTRDTTRGTTRA